MSSLSYSDYVDWMQALCYLIACSKSAFTSPYVTKRENANIFQSYRIEPGSLQGWKLDNNSGKDSIDRFPYVILYFARVLEKIN